MPAIQYQLNSNPNRKDFYHFLQTCKRSITQEDDQLIASLSFPIGDVDLLAVLDTIVKPDQKHFYFEKSGQEEAILAFDVALQFNTEGVDRFVAAKQFIQETLSKINQFGSLDLPFSGTHFFCNFSFFDQSSDHQSFPVASVFLPRWHVAKKSSGSAIVTNLLIDSAFNSEQAVTDIWQMLQKIQSVKHNVIPLALETPLSFFKQQFVSAPEHFQKSVASALKFIQSQHFHKIVLADALDVVAPIPFNVVHALSRLRSRYPNCYIFSANNGQGATFMGASPEKLVSLHQNRLMTDALAGSIARGKTRAEDARLAQTLLNSAKDKHEHQVVIDSIVQHLRNLGLAPQLSPARLLQLPNIQHLLTPIRAIAPTNFHLLDAVAELHPTPAVAGAPRNLACEHIRAFEPFERSLYAAPIGWLDHEGNGEFAVGIRSALIQGNRARLFAGAGIVAGSDPEKEFAEVHLKLQALLNALA